MDTINFWQFAFSFFFVIALMLGIAWLAQKFHFSKSVLPGRISGKFQRKLQIQEVLMLDRQHRVVRLHTNDQEFVLLLGQHGDTLLSKSTISSHDNDTVSEIPAA